MSVLKFERTASGLLTISGHVDLEEAKLYASVATASSDFDDLFSNDNFQELNAVTVSEEINFRCFGAPFVLDESSIELNSNELYTHIRFEAKQNCLFFANGVDFDTACNMANSAALTNNVEEIPVNGAVANRWEICAPKDIPVSALVSCFADYKLQNAILADEPRKVYA